MLIAFVNALPPLAPACPAGAIEPLVAFDMKLNVCKPIHPNIATQIKGMTMHNTLVRDIQQTGSLLDAVAQIVQSFGGFLMYLLIAVNISPTMTFYTLGGGVILVFLLRPFLRRAQHIAERASGVEKQFAQFLSEHIIGMKSIKAAGVERAAIADGNAHIHELRDLSIRQTFVRSIGTSFFQPFNLIFNWCKIV